LPTYKGFLLRELVDRLDEGENFHLTLLQVLLLLKKAWQEVKQETICNCFKEAKFMHNR
jgi:hypothetical protein